MNKQYNGGIALLKIIMSFSVVLNHFWINDSTIFGEYICIVAVPVFMLVSFTLMEEKLKSSNIQHILHRVYRLYIPHFCWAIIYWGIHQVIKWPGYKNISALGWQLLTGHSAKLNPPMWYQINLIILTILFWLIFCWFRNKATYILVVITILSLFLQYSGTNYGLFDGYIYEIKYPLGRIIEMLPYACLGIWLSEYKVFEKVKSRMWITQSILIILCVLGILCDLVYKPEGFGYQGVRWMILSVFLVINFYVFPFEKITAKVQKIIIYVSGYSLGIYCMHYIVGSIINSIFSKLSWEIGTVSECVVIYGVCLIGAICISKIPLKCCKDIIM